MGKHWKAVMAVAALIIISTQAYAVPAGKDVTWKGGGQGGVKFEGDEHAEKGYKCESCHPALFQMKKGSATITMAALNQGKQCGACHNGKAAFSTSDTKKCHECHTTRTKKKHHDSDDAKGRHHD